MALQKLAKKSGEARELVLTLDSLQASETLVAQLQSAADALAAQYRALVPMVSNSVTDPAVLSPYLDKAEQICAYYVQKKAFADALVSVNKRQQSAATTAAAAAASAAHAAGLPTEP
jgi:hypothetical protein